MKHGIWAGLDVGVETTSLCVMNDAGNVLQEITCATDLGTIHAELRWLKRRRSALIGLEASGGQTLARGLRSLGYSVEMYETRQLSKFLRLRRNKTDAGDAIGIAEAGRLGAALISKVHLKSLDCQALQSRLAIRRFLIRQRVATASLLCRQIELYGGRIRRSRRSSQLRQEFEAQIHKIFGRQRSPLIAELHGLLERCEDLLAYQTKTDAGFKRLAQEIDVCRRFMAIPGVGPICALTFYATVGDPQRFKRSVRVGGYFGLAPRIYQSGLTARPSRISRMGNSAMRTLLVQSAIRFMQLGNPGSDLWQWASGIERRSGRGQARIALARKLAVIMLSMWKNNQCYTPPLADGNRESAVTTGQLPGLTDATAGAA